MSFDSDLCQEEFYEAPEGCEELSSIDGDVINKFASSGEKLALVTSGSPNVPLETNSVRHLKFKDGFLGAHAFVEKLIEKGYRVIYLHHDKDTYPFTGVVKYPIKGMFLDASEVVFQDTKRKNNNLFLRVPKLYHQMCSSLIEYTSGDNPRLLCVNYTTFTQYLNLLKIILNWLKPAKANVLALICCSMPSHYIPKDKIFIHKISSSVGTLQIPLHPVPQNIVSNIFRKHLQEAFIVLLNKNSTPAFSISLLNRVNKSGDPTQTLAALDNENYHRLVVHATDMIQSSHDNWIALKTS